MRYLQSHIVNDANSELQISVEDEPGAGGANHLYMIRGFDTKTNESCPFTARHGQTAQHATVLFQNGPIGEKGVNGITHEALLAILADRLESFQAGPYASAYNAAALENIKTAQWNLQQRTRDRMAQGIEGTNIVGTESKSGEAAGALQELERHEDRNDALN